MKAFVVDASVALKWMLLEEHSELALVLLDGSFELHVDSPVRSMGNIRWAGSRPPADRSTRDSSP